MKTKFLAVLLFLAGLELWAQVPGVPTLPPPHRPRQSIASNVITNNGMTPPIYPASQPASAQPGTGPGNAGNPAGALPRNRARNANDTAGGANATANGATAEQEKFEPTINWQGLEINQVLDIYAQYVGRTLLRANIPDVKIILKTTSPLTREETIQALQAVLALNGVSVINVGDKFVKVLPSDQANTAAGDIDMSGSTNLPVLGSYVTHIVQLKYVKPSEMMPIIQPFAKLANSILAIDSNGILVLRDYAENVKRMLEMIEKIDISVPAEYISEVIPIRYAKVDDIASALNSLGGSGSSSVSIGGSAGSSSGTSRGAFGSSRFGGGVSSGGYGQSGSAGGLGGGSGIGGTSAFGARSTTLGGTAGATGVNGGATGTSTFAQRLNNIINRASSPNGGGGDQIQLFGQTKIIPNASSSTLLVYATRQDMQMIKDIISKIDVPLAQVLIEALIVDVTLGHDFSMGVSIAQNPKTLWNPNNSSNIVNTVAGAGGANNGASFLNFLSNVIGTNSTSTSSFGNSLGAFNYFGNLGPTWDAAVTAAADDSTASIIQRPRIQASQAQPAEFQVGESKPYVTSTYAGYTGGYGGSSYSQLFAGVELSVTPFINPDGLVVMDISQSINEFSGFTTIANVGDVPNTIQRQLSSEIAVRDHDTVMLGGFIKSNKSTSKSGVPYLMDIPILGNLFTSRSNIKDRSELIVLMRPTVLRTPEIAAQNTLKEEQRLPGVSQAAVEDSEYEHKLVEAQRKRQQEHAAKNGSLDGFFNPVTEAPSTNAASPKSEADKALEEILLNTLTNRPAK